MKKITLLIAICFTLLAGCATARGIAQDAENHGLIASPNYIPFFIRKYNFPVLFIYPAAAAASGPVPK